jgi:hypothetical protein
MTTPSLSLPIDRPSSPRHFPSVIAAWGALAALAAVAGLVDVERRLVVPAVLVTSVTAMVVAYRRPGPFREWARNVPWSALLAFQALRAPVGVAFLVWAARGLAPVGFASGAGYGDLAVGVLATGLLAFGSRVVDQRGAVLAWNVLGLLDIVAVVVGAQIRFVFGDPESIRGLLSTWFPLLPLFYVPLVFGAHFLVFARARELGSRRAAG